jgi:hypothetical protein
MWVRRWVVLVKPELMAEAVAHLRAAPPQEGVTTRVLRPISGAEAASKLVYEKAFEDPDAQIASWADPQPPDEWKRRWIELSQNRGVLELYQVQHTVEAEGEPGLWVDRRVRWVRDGWRAEALKRWRHAPAVPVSGVSIRLLTPSTGEKAAGILVVESTFDSLVEFTAALRKVMATPEGDAWRASVKSLELHEPTKELLRVVS